VDGLQRPEGDAAALGGRRLARCGARAPGGDERRLARRGRELQGPVAGGSKGAIYEIGIALFPEHRGQGVGTTAQRLLVRYLLDTMPAHRIEAYTEVENVAERRALEKAGFEREGVLRATIFRAGKWRDSIVYALLRD